MTVSWQKAAGALALTLFVCGCHTSHELETKSEVELKPIKVEPIHITLDINIKIDRALDDFFGDLDAGAVQEETLWDEEMTNE